MLQVISKSKVKPDRTEDFKAAIKAQAPKTRSDEGCLSMRVLQCSDQVTFIMDELWESMELFEKHLQGGGLAEFEKSIADIVDGPVEPYFGELLIEV